MPNWPHGRWSTGGCCRDGRARGLWRPAACLKATREGEGEKSQRKTSLSQGLGPEDVTSPSPLLLLRLRQAVSPIVEQSALRSAHLSPASEHGSCDIGRREPDMSQQRTESRTTRRTWAGRRTSVWVLSFTLLAGTAVLPAGSSGGARALQRLMALGRSAHQLPRLPPHARQERKVQPGGLARRVDRVGRPRASATPS